MAVAGPVCSAGLTQQACMRAARPSGAFGSMLPWRTTQRKVAWICPLGQPNRSYRSRCLKAVSRSSRHKRFTTRRPSQTHSGLAAGPPRAAAASEKSSILRGPSFEVSAGACAGCCWRGRSAGLSPFWARTRPGTTDAIAQSARTKARTTGKDIDAWFCWVVRTKFALLLSAFDWVSNGAFAAAADVFETGLTTVHLARSGRSRWQSERGGLSRATFHPMPAES